MEPICLSKHSKGKKRDFIGVSPALTIELTITESLRAPQIPKICTTLCTTPRIPPTSSDMPDKLCTTLFYTPTLRPTPHSHFAPHLHHTFSRPLSHNYADNFCTTFFLYAQTTPSPYPCLHISSYLVYYRPLHLLNIPYVPFLYFAF
jgi:hypothetical protein